MSARFRHRSRNSGQVEVIVTPGDGRYVETFRADQNELRRFAWAILADFDPDEASATAAEAGQSLLELVGPARLTAPRPPSPKILQLGSKKWRLLQAIASGARTTAEAHASVPEASNPGALITELRHEGLVARANAGGQGVAAVWRPTEAGVAELQRQASAA